MLRAVRLEALLLAAVLTALPLYEAFVEEVRPVEDALLRYLLAAVLCSLALSMLSAIYYSYAAKIPRRRRTDDLIEVVEDMTVDIYAPTAQPSAPEYVAMEKRHLLD